MKKDEVEEFEELTSTDGGNELFAGYCIGDIGQALPDEWDESKKKRFINWFLLKGIMEGWIYDEFGI